MNTPAIPGDSAVVVIDMINTYDHADAAALTDSVRRMLPNLQRLLQRARAGDVPVIYVNDNFGLWRSHHEQLLDKALQGPHADLVDPIRPDEESLFVVKARHSVFYQTPLDYLLQQHGIRRPGLCGQVTEQCVLYSALDAHIRHYDVAVVRDAVAHIHSELARAALRMMEVNTGAQLDDAASVRLDGGPVFAQNAAGFAGEGVRLAADLTESGRRVVADLTGARLAAVAAGGAYLLKISHEELREEGLAPTGSVPELVAAMHGLSAQGAHAIVVSRAADPALALIGTRLYEVELGRMEVADPLGSGDSMTAGIAAGLMRGLDLPEALRLGAAAGAVNATRHGLGTGGRQAVEQLAKTVRLRPLAEPAAQVARVRREELTAWLSR